MKTHGTNPRSPEGWRRWSPQPLAVVAVAMALLLAGCSTSDATLDSERIGVGDLQRGPDLSRVLGAMLAPTDEHAVAGAIAGLPDAQRTTRRVVPGRHSTRPGTVLTLHYAGSAVTLYQPGDDAPPLLAEVDVASEGFTWDGLEVGMTEGELSAVLGTPTSSTRDQAVYRLSGSTHAPHEVTVTLVDGAVTSLRWAAYLD